MDDRKHKYIFSQIKMSWVHSLYSLRVVIGGELYCLHQ